MTLKLALVWEDDTRDRSGFAPDCYFTNVRLGTFAHVDGLGKEFELRTWQNDNGTWSGDISFVTALNDRTIASMSSCPTEAEAQEKVTAWALKKLRKLYPEPLLVGAS